MEQQTPTQVALSEPEVARRLGIGLRTLQRWRYRHVSPVKRLPGTGRVVRYSQAEVNRYLEGKR